MTINRNKIWILITAVIMLSTVANVANAGIIRAVGKPLYRGAKVTGKVVVAAGAGVGKVGVEVGKDVGKYGVAVAKDTWQLIY